MRTNGWARSAAGLALAVAAFGAGLRADDAADDMRKLAGSWKVVEMTARGQQAPADARQAITFEFAAGKMKLLNSKRSKQDAEMNFALKLDAGTTPRHFDAVSKDGGKKGSTMLGLYEFTGARLKLALPNRPGAERPKSFADAAKGDVAVFTLEKIAGN